MIAIWCDGAASKNGQKGAIGGYGWVARNNNKFYCSGGRSIGATNQQMELMAAIDALKWCDENSDDKYIVISTDSAYLYNCWAQGWWKNWECNGWINSTKKPVANKELWEQLIPYFKRAMVMFEKVKGHADNEGNQYADKLAVAARTMENIQFQIYTTMLLEELNDRLDHSCL